MNSKLILQIRILSVFVLFLVGFKSYCQGDTESYSLDSVVYSAGKDDIQIKNIQGCWRFDNEVVIIEDSLWISSVSDKKYKLAIHFLTSDIDSFTMIHLCNQCVSFNDNNLPADEIILYKILEYNHNELKVENFVTQEIKSFIRCDD